MSTNKSRFAWFVGIRGFFPASLLNSARQELTATLADLGHETHVLDAAATRYGAVETPAEGAIYARFLEENRGKFDGVILSLPNFGDENGAVAALKDAEVPIFVQAYPDELRLMAPDARRDAFCGKLSIMDVFFQNGIKYTVQKPHVVAPTSKAFTDNIKHFDSVCQVVKGLRGMTVGAIGARTTAFKTVRFDELALQRAGITVETFDLSDVFPRLTSVDASSAAYKDKVQRLRGYTNFSTVPGAAFDNLVRMGVVLDQIIEECSLDAVAVRCWIEMQQQLGISVCVLLSEMNDRGLTAACELDVANAVAMHALGKASGNVSACLDWNNNYGDEADKCILFHCGPVPQSLMTGKGCITCHAILDTVLGEGKSWGCNVGRIRPTPFTFSSMMTAGGRLKFYVGEGQFTEDPVPDDFFGCAGVAEIPNLEDVLLHVARNGHRHHVSVAPGHTGTALGEALENYLDCDVTFAQRP